MTSMGRLHELAHYNCKTLGLVIACEYWVDWRAMDNSGLVLGRSVVGVAIVMGHDLSGHSVSSNVALGTC